LSSQEIKNLLIQKIKQLLSDSGARLNHSNTQPDITRTPYQEPHRAATSDWQSNG
jgi:hypothetical protein